MAASGQDRIERRLAAILAADVAGYSRLTGVDEEGTHVQLQAHLRALVDPKVAEHRGRVVKNTGDGMLAEFSSVVDAVRCALDVQRGMAERNAGVPDEKRIEFRMGINVGDIIIDRGDIFGDGVNVAARLEGLAKPGGICISDDAHRQVRGKFDVTFEDVGERQLKNIARPVRVFQVALDDARPAKPISQPHNAASAVRRQVEHARHGDRSRSRTDCRRCRRSIVLPPRPRARTAAGPAGKALEGFSIVVLPFANLSGDASQDYLADVISDELTHRVLAFSETASSSPGQPLSLTRANQSTCGRSARISVCAMRWKAACSRVATGCV